MRMLAIPSLIRRWPLEHAAAAVALLYGVLKIYWALGGTGLRSTIGFPKQVWDESWFIALGLWGTVLLSLLAIIIPYALDRGAWRAVPRWMLLIPIWVGCVFCVVRGVGGVIQDILYLVGAIRADFPEMSKAQGERVIAWSLFLYSPWFLIWGILLGAVGLKAHRRSAPG